MLVDLPAGSALRQQLATGIYEGSLGFDQRHLILNEYPFSSEMRTIFTEEMAQFRADDSYAPRSMERIVGIPEDFGVCDNHEQILARWADRLDEPGRYYTIFLHPIRKANQEPEGGWRWHKWGNYIGTHEITTEYLYDEPLIEQVFIFQIYEVTAPS